MKLAIHCVWHHQALLEEVLDECYFNEMPLFF